MTRWSAVVLAVSLTLACADGGPVPSADQGGSSSTPAPTTTAGTAGSPVGGAGASGTPEAPGGVSGGGSGGAGVGGSSGESTVSGGHSGASDGGASGSSSGAATGGSTGMAGAGGASAARGKVTMVIRGSGTPTPGDKLMIGRLEAFGYREVITVKDADATATGVMGSDLVVISSSAESGPLRDRLKDIPIPVLCVEDAEFKLMGMASAGDHDAGISQIVVKEGGSPLLGALSGTIAISSLQGELGWATPAATAIVGATMPGDAKRAVVFGYPAGAQMATMVAPARRAGFAIREQLAANLNTDGIAVFDSVLAWVAAE